MNQETRISRLFLRRILSIIIRILFSIKSTLIYKNRIDVTKPCIIAVFHGEMLPVLDSMKNTKAVFLASKNHAGSALAKVLSSWGYEIVYGSPGGRGKEALEELVDEIKKGKMVIITPDGSRGPRHKMKAGAVILAHKTNAPLYLVRPKYSGIKIKPLWDHFLYPFPFSKVKFIYTKMTVPSGLTRQEVDEKIKETEVLFQDL